MSFFNGKVVLITGATAGIGLACAKEFSRSNAKVILVGRSTEKGEKVVSATLQGNSNCEFIAADMSKSDDINRLFSYISMKYRNLDIAINNAGTDGSSFTSILEYPDEIWDKVMALNVTSVFLSMKHQIQLMKKNGGAIVNVASIAGLRASYTGGCAYTASKHAVVGLTKSAALDTAKMNIRINAVCPGLIRTETSEREFGDALDDYGSIHPIGRIGEPQDVSDVILWLCSDKSAFVTGAIFPVDGGVMAK